MITKCLYCKKRLKTRMYSNNWGVKWYDCEPCGKNYKRGYTRQEYERIGIRNTQINEEYEPILIDITREVQR